MFLVIAAYLGGVLTILSPCILPVLPFVFTRSDQPFTRSGLPILLGMAITFAAVASLAAVGGGWVVEANYYGRLAAIVLMALFGITLLLPGLSERMTRPIVALGARLSQTAGGRPSAPRWSWVWLRGCCGCLAPVLFSGRCCMDRWVGRETPNPVWVHPTRTESGRPNSSIRFRT
jgi:cytochrome c biogenesis protein CcdA